MNSAGSFRIGLNVYIIIHAKLFKCIWCNYIQLNTWKLGSLSSNIIGPCSTTELAPTDLCNLVKMPRSHRLLPEMFLCPEYIWRWRLIWTKQGYLHSLTSMEKTQGVIMVVYAKEKFMLVYLLLNLQNFYLANGEESFGVWTYHQDTQCLSVTTSAFW